jgi:heme-degrading monooxygenase HmoA
MYIAMNRFNIVPGKEADFEQICRERETYLKGVPGFVQSRC